tara:strand:- start:265 stop:1329 length:1065 start_codon:yes stop_codon:yes gene_type:complete
MKSKNKILSIITFVLIVFSSCNKDIEIQQETAPFNLIASDNYPLGILLQWNKLENFDGFYNVYRKYSTGEWEVIESIKFDEYSILDSDDYFYYFDDSVLDFSDYQYYISAINDGNDIANIIQGIGEKISNTVIGQSVELTVENSFQLLANLTGGVYNTTPENELTETIISIIHDYAKDGGADIMFLIDKTGSMENDINNIQKGLNLIIDSMPLNCRLGLATYGDLMVDSVFTDYESFGNWYDFQDLTSDYNLIQDLINSIITTGGGEYPESVFDGIFRTVNDANWLFENKMILVIGDAPPIINPCIFPLSDNIAECSMNSIIDVITLCNSYNVSANLYPVLIGPDSFERNSYFN